MSVEKPWLKNYKIGPFKLPHSMAPYPNIPVYQFLDDSSKTYPDNIACTFLGENFLSEMTYKELKNEVDAFTAALVDIGVEKGDIVITILPSCPQFIIADYAIMKAGGIHAPLSILHQAPELLYEVQQTRSRIIICSYRRLDRIVAIQEQIQIDHVIYTQVPSFPDYTIPDTTVLPSISNLHSMKELTEKYYDKLPPPTLKIIPQEDLALLPFTGGTTGMPKATMLTHANVTTNVVQAFHWMVHPLRTGVIGKAAVVIMVPIFHQMGHWMMHACISWGLRILLVDARDLNTITQTIKKYRPFMVGGVPTHYTLLLNSDLPKMPVFFFSGAAALPRDVAKQWEKKIGIPLGEGYGMSEATACTHLNLSGLSKVTGFIPKVKVGIGIPIPDTEVKLIDPDTGEECSPGNPGELWIRGPQVMKGYWPTPGSGLDDAGWLATGDIGKIDEEGYFHIVDRIKDMINVSGMKVYSQTVDDVLYAHPAVNVAGVIGIPDPERPGSERVKAFLVLKSDHDQVTEEDIINYCKEKLPPYAIPKSVEFRNQLPLTSVMKLDKKKLRREEQAKSES
ncbi:MAG: hypothetical protein EAX86_03760 [Candidatus Heimdallarchaeota archaeon]|nr:hypothetical protein [Candidatus Heimdallarchaeota archaeon]